MFIIVRTEQEIQKELDRLEVLKDDWHQPLRNIEILYSLCAGLRWVLSNSDKDTASDYWKEDYKNRPSYRKW